jgi:hypothetical protein
MVHRILLELPDRINSKPAALPYLILDNYIAVGRVLRGSVELPLASVNFHMRTNT